MLIKRGFQGTFIRTYVDFYIALLAGLSGLCMGVYFHSITWENIPIHALIEIIGAILAIIVVVLFFLGLKIHAFDESQQRWLVAGLISMSCLDLIHAVSPIGNQFVWFHSLAVFSGGWLFAGVMLPTTLKKLTNSLYFLFIATIISVSLYTLIPGDHIPLMVNAGQFTLLARLLNISGGIAFFLAFICFISRYKKMSIQEDKVLALHCLLFSLGGLLFEYSSLWDISWWWWHVLRLGAYSLLFYFILIYYDMVQAGLLKQKEQKELEYKLLYDKFEFVTNQAGIGIWEWDIHSGDLVWNDVMYEMYDVPIGTKISYQDWKERVSNKDLLYAESELHKALVTDTTFDLHFSIDTENQNSKIVKAIGKKYSRSLALQDQTFIGINIDITEQKRIERQLTDYARNDEVTGLYNRKYFLNLFEKAVSQAQENNRILSILFVDLDDFKTINDTYGHLIGDKVLSAVAEIIRESIEIEKIIARVGGDEFVILLPNLASAEQAGDIACTLLSNLNTNLKISDTKIDLICSYSIGIAVFPYAGKSPEALLISADIAMYQAKAKGKNQYRYFSPELQKAHTHKIKLEKALSKAIKNNEFYLVYQPIVNLNTHAIDGVEALLRWRSSDFDKTLSPNDFILLAERNGMIHDIGEWVMAHTMRDWSYVTRHFTYPLTLSINLSAKEFSAPNIAKTLITHLEDNALSPTLLNIELTETAFIENSTYAQDVFNELTSFGISLTLDDFGTGYSSLSYLYQYPFKNIKIDKSFIRLLLENMTTEKIIKTLIELGDILNMNIVFEGIESRLQLSKLRSLQTNRINIELLGQGYFIQKPLAFDDLLIYLHQQLN